MHQDLGAVEAIQQQTGFSTNGLPIIKTCPLHLKRLVPVVISAAIFGRHWSGKLVNFMVDNLAVVQVLQATYSRDIHLMHLIRLLVLFAAHFNFWFTASHVAGKKNTCADAISRNDTEILQQLPVLLVQSITWTCTSWIQPLDSIFRQL